MMNAAEFPSVEHLVLELHAVMHGKWGAPISEFGVFRTACGRTVRATIVGVGPVPGSYTYRVFGEGVDGDTDPGFMKAVRSWRDRFMDQLRLQRLADQTVTVKQIGAGIRQAIKSAESRYASGVEAYTSAYAVGVATDGQSVPEWAREAYAVLSKDGRRVGIGHWPLPEMRDGDVVLTPPEGGSVGCVLLYPNERSVPIVVTTIVCGSLPFEQTLHGAAHRALEIEIVERAKEALTNLSQEHHAVFNSVPEMISLMYDVDGPVHCERCAEQTGVRTQMRKRGETRSRYWACGCSVEPFTINPPIRMPACSAANCMAEATFFCGREYACGDHVVTHPARPERLERRESTHYQWMAYSHHEGVDVRGYGCNAEEAVARWRTALELAQVQSDEEARRR